MFHNEYKITRMKTVDGFSKKQTNRKQSSMKTPLHIPESKVKKFVCFSETILNFHYARCDLNLDRHNIISMDALNILDNFGLMNNSTSIAS